MGKTADNITSDTDTTDDWFKGLLVEIGPIAMMQYRLPKAADSKVLWRLLL